MFRENKTSPEQTAVVNGNLGLRTEETNIINIAFNNGTAQFYKTNTIDAAKTISYSFNVWYHIRYEFDQEKRQYSVYWNGSQSKHINNYAIRSGTFTRLNSVRLTLGGENSAMLTDNVMLYKLGDAPSVTALDYITADGQEVLAPSFAPHNTTHLLARVNTPLTGTTVNADNVSVIKDGEAVALEKAELSSDGQTIDIVPRYPLLTASGYEVRLSSRIRAVNGMSAREQSTAFEVLPAPFDVTEGVFVQNGKELSALTVGQGDGIGFKAKINNQTGESQTVLAILILRKDGRLVGITSKSAEIPAGESWVETESLQAEQGDTVAEAFVWNGWPQRISVSSKIFR
jgi:hypothetical protein